MDDIKSDLYLRQFESRSAALNVHRNKGILFPKENLAMKNSSAMINQPMGQEYDQHIRTPGKFVNQREVMNSRKMMQKNMANS